MLINKKYGNPKIVVDGGELARNINRKVRNTISSISIRNIVNQLGKYVFPYGSVVDNLKETTFF